MRIRSLTAAGAAVVLTLVAGLLATPAAGVVPDWHDTGTTASYPGNDRVMVEDLRHATHERFDRVVIELRGPMPDHRTGYARRFTYDGSGDPIPVRGRAGLWIALTAAGHTADGDTVYAGPRLARPRYETLKALALAGDWEGQVTFFLALRHRAPYRIFHLSDPSRMVIDVRHRT